jgi:hypothetical protein
MTATQQDILFLLAEQNKTLTVLAGKRQSGNTASPCENGAAERLHITPAAGMQRPDTLPRLRTGRFLAIPRWVALPILRPRTENVVNACSPKIGNNYGKR